MDKKDFLSLDESPVETVSIDIIARERLETVSFDKLRVLDIKAQRFPGLGLLDLGGRFA